MGVDKKSVCACVCVRGNEKGWEGWRCVLYKKKGVLECQCNLVGDYGKGCVWVRVCESRAAASPIFLILTVVC